MVYWNATEPLSYHTHANLRTWSVRGTLVLWILDLRDADEYPPAAMEDSQWIGLRSRNYLVVRLVENGSQFAGYDSLLSRLETSTVFKKYFALS